MCDNVDAFLEDILSLPRWVNRALTLLRELDVKSQQCGEEAQRRRDRYLDLARTKLQASNSQQIPDGFYNDPELEAEAAASTDRGREAHALMKEKVIVLNQLLRVLRGETESFKLSLAKFAKEVGGEELLRQSRRRPDDSLIPSDQNDDAGQRVGPPSVAGASPLSSRTAASRARVGLPISATDGSVHSEQSIGLLGPSEVPTPSDAVCSLPLGVPSTGSGTSRNRPSKKSAVRSSSSAVAFPADGGRPAKRPRPSAVGTPAKKHQGKEGAFYEGIDEDCVAQVQPPGEVGIGPSSLLQGSPPCSGSISLPTQQGPPGGRVKRSKHPADTLPNSQSSGSLLSQLSPSDLYGDQATGGRPTRGSAGRIKKGKEHVPEIATAATDEAVRTPGYTSQCDPSVADGQGLDGGTMQPTGLLIRLPPNVPLQQQSLLAAKAKSLAERSMKPTSRSLATRVPNHRTGPG